jgi:hypothetical protein
MSFIDRTSGHSAISSSCSHNARRLCSKWQLPFAVWRRGRVLKVEDAKDQLTGLVRATGLSGFDLDEIVIGLGEFWCDKNIRNRLIHDQWFPG